MINVCRLRTIVRLLCTSDIVWSSLRIALVVGTVLNLINQGTRWWHGDELALVYCLLNYMVPYCVAAYSAMRTRLQYLGASER